MALKHFKPTTPGQRQLVLIDRSDLYKGKPVKTLVESKSSTGGRNNSGRITARRRAQEGLPRGGLQASQVRRDRDGRARLEYDPNRSAFIALIKYADGELAYILAPQRLSVGDTVVGGERADIKPGNAMPLNNIPVGTIVHNVELKPARAARSPVRQAPTRSSSAVTRATRRSNCVRANCAWCRPVHGHHRRGVEPDHHERSDRQGRS
jgi:large subunit ribosomal protein L2